MDHEQNNLESAGYSIRVDDIMIDCDNAQKLGDFYAGLLGWEKITLSDDCVQVSSPGQSLRFLLQEEEDYIPPVWPEMPDKQQKMLHLDFTVDNLNNAVSRAVSLGAVKAEKQYNPSQWVTMFDPAGHPFCLCLAE